MSVAAFLTELHRNDIRVWLEGEKLRCSAPAGALTDALRDELQQRKHDIVAFLHMAQGAAAQPGALVPLQPHGAGVPVFLVPGAGDVFSYRAFGQALGAEQPLFGLQAPGFDGGSEPLARVEDLAAYFARQIRAVRPDGPWIVAGKCLGGTVAFELARQLFAGREATGRLVLFGAPYPRWFDAWRLPWLRLAHRAELWPRRLRALAAQSNRERMQYVNWRLRRVSEEPDPAAALQASVVAATIRAVRRYEPRPFAGRVDHFVPSAAWGRRQWARGWRSVASSLEVHPGPDGCTRDEMLAEPYAAGFAIELKRVIKQ